MMSQSADSIRTRIDRIRDTALSLEELQRMISEDPEGFVESQGLLGKEAAQDPEVTGHGTIHVCPWQTCQATRMTLDS